MMVPRGILAFGSLALPTSNHCIPPSRLGRAFCYSGGGFYVLFHRLVEMLCHPAMRCYSAPVGPLHNGGFLEAVLSRRSKASAEQHVLKNQNVAFF